jgi:hypothetical protein
LSTPSPSPDNRFLAVRYAAQDSDEFRLEDVAVRRFLELRDEGASNEQIGSELGLDAAAVKELVHADEAQALAHRIAIGEEPKYPAPSPDEQIVDGRSGSSVVPMIILAIVLIGGLIYLAAR